MQPSFYRPTKQGQRSDLPEIPELFSDRPARIQPLYLPLWPTAVSPKVPELSNNKNSWASTGDTVYLIRMIIPVFIEHLHRLHLILTIITRGRNFSITVLMRKLSHREEKEFLLVPEFSEFELKSVCCHEIKRCLLLGRKVMTNLDSILKSRDITLPTKVRIIKAMVFPVVMYRCESWTIKTAECQRIDAFELGCWRRLLRVPWTGRISNQSILKEINPEYSWEGLMLKLKLQYFDHLIVKSWLTGKDPDPGKDWRQKEKGTAEDEMVK